MLPLSTCKSILENGSDNKYSNKDVKFIRELLYRFAEIDYQNYKAQKAHEQKSRHLYSRLN